MRRKSRKRSCAFGVGKEGRLLVQLAKHNPIDNPRTVPIHDPSETISHWLNVIRLQVKRAQRFRLDLFENSKSRWLQSVRPVPLFTELLGCLGIRERSGSSLVASFRPLRLHSLTSTDSQSCINHLTLLLVRRYSIFAICIIISNFLILTLQFFMQLYYYSKHNR